MAPNRQEPYGLCLGAPVPCRAERLFWVDGYGPTRVKAVLNRDTTFSHQHFWGPRRTILAFVHSIPPQRIDGHDQIRDRRAILAHSRSARRERRCGRHYGDLVSQRARIETRSWSLPSASNVHQRDQWSGHHKQNRKVDRTAICNTITRLPPG
jgi:hypothetical protein